MNTKNEYLNALRHHMAQVLRLGNPSNFIAYQIQEDEVYDPLLLSYRVYGTTTYSEVVLCCAEVDGVYEPLPLKKIALPPLNVIHMLRRDWGIT